MRADAMQGTATGINRYDEVEGLLAVPPPSIDT
jgi:hypothetical protein